MRIWHISLKFDGRGIANRAFITAPKNPIRMIYLMVRGWYPFNEYWWSKLGRRA